MSSQETPDLYMRGGRYHLLSEIGKGGMGIVYQAEDRLTGQIVALKRMHIPEINLSFSWTDANEPGRISLAREFQTLAAMRHPNIINVLDYGFDTEEQPYFTMTLLEDARDILQYAQDKRPTEKIRLIIEVLQALVYLHQRHIIHRDLKPGNILVTGDGHVRVLDFGLAVEMSDVRDMAGSLAYMAPEILNEQPATPVSDLYAVGILIYSMYTGRHPFGDIRQQIHQMVKAIATQIPDTRPVSEVAGEDMAYIVATLLEKDPAERYQSAQDVIKEICELTAYPVPAESIDIRESFLQTAPFIGREELNILTDGIKKLMTNRGSAFLIAGESGLGKSRLLDEVRIQALVRGIQVISVQVTEEQDFFQLWRNILQHLLLTVPIRQGNAGLLKKIVPNIEKITDTRVRAVPMIMGESGIQALNSVIISTFAYIRQPIVLLLDDLHYATSDILLLRRISQMLPGVPMLMIGSYRSDDFPYFYGKFPEMQAITLKRFSRDELTQLSRAILGEAGAQESVLDFLTLQTEGNPFYAVETLRSLAEDTGRLADVAQMMLPDSVLAPGVLEIVERRLQEIPEDYQHLLRYAALIGRKLNLELLEYIDESLDMIEWLEACSNAGILDYIDNAWQFTHDKVREGILHHVSHGEQLQLATRITEVVNAGRMD